MVESEKAYELYSLLSRSASTTSAIIQERAREEILATIYPNSAWQVRDGYLMIQWIKRLHFAKYSKNNNILFRLLFSIFFFVPFSLLNSLHFSFSISSLLSFLSNFYFLSSFFCFHLFTSFSPLFLSLFPSLSFSLFSPWTLHNLSMSRNVFSISVLSLFYTVHTFLSFFFFLYI